MSYDYWVKIIVLGNAFVGKTALVQSLVHNTPISNNVHTTIGVESESLIMKIGNKKVKCLIWDTAGQEIYRALINSYYRGCAGAIIVFDVTTKKSFEDLKYWLEKIRTHNPVKTTSIVIVANKIDKTRQRVIAKEMIENFCYKEGLKYFETSAKIRTTKTFFTYLVNSILINNMTSIKDHDGIKCITEPVIKEREENFITVRLVYNSLA